MMKVFGVSKTHATRLDMGDLAATPVGTSCAWCDDPIVEGDKGVIMPFLGLADDPRREIPYHWDCNIRAVVGSVAHQNKQCSCFVPGAGCGDDPALTKRQAANAAVVLFQSRSPTDHLAS